MVALPAVPEPPPPLVAIARGVGRLAAAGQFSGTVLVAKNGKHVFVRAYGSADRRARTPNRVDTAFNLASVGKTFTGVAVAQLAQRRKLRFDDTVGKYIAGLPPDIGRVTVKQLLTHSSGLGDFFQDPGYATLRPTLRTLKAYLPLITWERLRFPPGTQFSYSNSGYLLLGLVIERASGMDYYAYVRRNVLDAAGMRSSGCYWNDRLPPNAAVGYYADATSNTATLPPRGTSAGGCYASAFDLLAFANALVRHKLLNAAYTANVTSPHIFAPGGAYGYGFGIRQGRPGEPATVWHNGGAPGIGAELDIAPKLGWTVVILANNGPAAVQPVADLILNALSVP